MKNYKAKNIDEFIASAPKEARPKMKEIREVIRAAVPKAEESISWGVPFYKYQGALVGFAPLKNYVLFGLAFFIEDKYRKAFEKKGYTTQKKTVRIGFDQKVPAAIIRPLLKERAKMNEAAKAKK